MVAEERHTNVGSRTRTKAAAAISHGDALLHQHTVCSYHEIRKRFIEHATRTAFTIWVKIDPATFEAFATA